MIQAGRGAIPPPKRINPASGQTGRAYKSTNHTHHYSQSPAQNQPLGFADVRAVAAGRWESIHRALGVNLTTTSHQKHTPCPGCGGRDRFRVDLDYANTGRWICGGGGDMQQGDGFALLAHVHGWTLAESLRAVADHLGLTRLPDHQRAAIRLQADRQAAQFAAAARRKDEQARTDANLLGALENMIDAIRYRQYMQRAVNGAVVVYPTADEITAAQALNTAILDNYANKDATP